MRKTISLFAALLLVATLFLAVAGCMDRAMAPKEESKSATETPTTPAQSSNAPTTK